MPNLFLQYGGDKEPIAPVQSLNEIEALRMLAEAEITASKLIPWGSNYSFAVGLEPADGSPQLGIYKPRDGEAPLHDFPHGTLYKREVAAYQLSRDLGWDLVPPTVVRDGIHGIGSLQLYIAPLPEEDDDSRSFWGQKTVDIERVVVFDYIVNNADRKLSHCLRDTSRRVWGIDHGLTFNVAPKLRTVLWQFVDCEIATEILEDLDKGRGNPALFANLRPYLTVAEIDAFATRIDRVIEMGRHPGLNPYRNVPYGWW